jgi:hypothetical protein
MNIDGPAISFFTSCWLLPQKEQYNVVLGELSKSLAIKNLLSVLTFAAVQGHSRMSSLSEQHHHAPLPQNGFEFPRFLSTQPQKVYQFVVSVLNGTPFNSLNGHPILISTFSTDLRLRSETPAANSFCYWDTQHKNNLNFCHSQNLVLQRLSNCLPWGPYITL